MYAFAPESGRQVPVTLGLITTVAGGVQLAMQIDEGDAAILPLHAGNQLIVAVADMVSERLAMTAELLSEENPGEGQP